MVLNISKKHVRLSAFAFEEAKQSDMSSKHGCIIAKGKKILIKGNNSYRNYSKDKLLYNTCSSHAEIDALRKLYKIKPKWKNVTLYVVRRSGSNYIDSSPCKWCLNQLKYFNIKKIVYSISTNKLKYCKTANFVSYGFSTGHRHILDMKYK
uniref:CMP/dCMP-type deaminase domain-containing protein n=1 Tax=viral metagenome TaxID=1070528 RepID=A0A6C0KDX8_9ZZZZ